MNDILRKTKELSRIYRERNKLLIDAGLEDFTFSHDEIEKIVAEEVGKQLTKKINNTIKEAGL